MYTRPSYPILEDAMRRPIQYRITDVDVFGGPEYRACLDHIFEVAGTDPALGRILPETVVRVFSPGAVVALHGDPDLKLVSTLAGRPSGGRALRARCPWRSTSACCGATSSFSGGSGGSPLPIPPGHGCFVPSRWAHWLTHPVDVPVVSFEIGYWYYESINARKVYDVNWMLRRVGLKPQVPGAGRDALKRRVFDGISTLTRKGVQYRGI